MLIPPKCCFRFVWAVIFVGLVCVLVKPVVAQESKRQAVTITDPALNRESSASQDKWKLLERVNQATTKRRREFQREKNEIRQRLNASAADLKNVAARVYVNVLQIAEQRMSAEHSRVLADSEFSDQWVQSYELRMDAARAEIAAITLQKRFTQLDVASRLIVERRQKLVLQQYDLYKRFAKLQQDELELLHKYFDQADVSGVATADELRSDLQILEESTQENPGARLATAITLMRLGRTGSAAKVLAEVQGQHKLARPLAMALRAEIQAKSGKSVEARKTLANAARLAPSEPRLAWVEARMWAILGEGKRAFTSWQKLQKSRQFGFVTHRGIALTYCLQDKLSRREATKAAERARLACSLSGGEDWCSEIAHALATAHLGDFAEAAKMAESAAQLTSGDKQQICIGVAEQLSSGTIPAWRF